MLAILSDYSTIYTSTNEWDRKRRHVLSQEWIQKTYPTLPKYTELIEFLSKIEKQSIIKIGLPFELKVLFPVFDKEIFENKNVEAMKMILFKWDYDAFLNYKNDHSTNLLQMALSYAPNDIELLNKQFECQKRYYEYTIHEVPWGVLYDENGANVEQTKENLNALAEFKNLYTKIRKNEDGLFDKCQFYYTAWIEYLTNRNGYINFEDYLSKHTK